jgi:hypothetical protein
MRNTSFYEVKFSNEEQNIFFRENLPNNNYGSQALRIAQYDIYSACRYLKMYAKVDLLGKIKSLGKIKNLKRGVEE